MMRDYRAAQVNDFIPWLRDRRGIEAVEVTIMKRGSSSFSREKNGDHVRVPYLRINARGASYREIIESEAMGLVNDGYYEKILPVWHEYLQSKNADMDECYDADMYIGASYYDKLCYCDFAYGQKEKVKEYLWASVGKTPRDLYASTLPGLNIVYETADFKKLKLNDPERIEKIKNDIFNMAREFVEDNYGPAEFHFNVTVWHPKMQCYNGYGMARED